jgi:DNA-binding protein Fis
MQVLSIACWNKKRAAELLKISRVTLDKKIKVYNLPPQSKI